MKFWKFSIIRLSVCAFALGIVANAFCFWHIVWYGMVGWGNTFDYNKGEFAIHYVDVRDGDCTIIQFPDGKNAIIDIGEEIYFNRVNDYIKTRIKPKNNKFDYVIETHPHSDHNGGFGKLKKKYKVGQWIDWLNVEEGQVINGKDYRIQFHGVATQAQRDKFSGLSKELLNSVSSNEVNEISPIITVEYFAKQKHVFVITGDAGNATEALVMKPDSAFEEIFDTSRTDDMVVHLQVGHHGSDTSGSSAWYGMLGASYAVISVGTRYPSLPTTATKKFLRDYDVEYYLTREVGNIATVVDNDDVRFIFGYENVPDLTAVWVVIALCVVVVCFANYYILWCKKC